MNDQFEAVQQAGGSWKRLYRIGAVAAIVAVLFFRRYFAAEFSLLWSTGVITAGLAEWPVSAGDWFTVLQTTPLVGLILLNLVDLVNYTLVGMIFLGVYAALRCANRSWVTVAAALGLVGIASYLASNQAFAMLALSNKYAAAGDEGQRYALRAAGEALLAMNEGGTGQYIGLLFVVLAGLIFSIIMLRSDVFNKATAYTGLGANSLMAIMFLVWPFNPPWLPLLPSLSALFRVTWYVLIARRLWQLGARSA
ncbi:MAG: DUF4386 family protein [Anaerolineales bacterium]|nr:DUF4386 family protein [Anaerolineales bacterium]